MRKGEQDWLNPIVERVKSLMASMAEELSALDPAYVGGEEWDPDEGFLFTADSISPLREQHSEQVQQLCGEESQTLRQKDLSGCIAASRIRHQTEWVLKMKMPATDKHVLMCISFCDGAIPDPPNPYNEKPTVHPGI